MNGLLLKNGRLLDPSCGLDDVGDVLVIGDKIVSVGGSLDECDCNKYYNNDCRDGDIEIIDVSGKYVVPGLIDMHTHLREPGYEYKEDISSGAWAAVHGGFTSVACMPNTAPVADSCSIVEHIKMRAEKVGAARVYTIGAITKGLQGKELSEIAELHRAGVVALSDDGCPVENSEVMRRALEYCKMFDLPIISHAEDKQLSGDGVMHEGYYSLIYGMKGIPAASEEVMIARDIILAELTGCQLHIAHVSTEGSVRLVREAKKNGVRITAEVTPHHLALTDEMLSDYDTDFKVNPPLRSERDVAALKEGLRDGTIDIIATDHAPHSPEDKDVEFDYAPFGMIGLETAFAIVYQELVLTGVLTLEQLIAKMSCNPAKIFCLPGGTLSAGCPADITVIDLEAQETVAKNSFMSKSVNSPFVGRKLKGLPVMTVVDGKVLMRGRKLCL